MSLVLFQNVKSLTLVTTLIGCSSWAGFSWMAGVSTAISLDTLVSLLCNLQKDIFMVITTEWEFWRQKKFISNFTPEILKNDEPLMKMMYYRNGAWFWNGLRRTYRKTDSFFYYCFQVGFLFNLRLDDWLFSFNWSFNFNFDLLRNLNNQSSFGRFLLFNNFSNFFDLC